MAKCDDLATQLTGLQSQISGLQNQLSDLQSQLSDLEYQRTHPNQACEDQGLTGIDCELYLKGLGPQIRSTQSQIAGVQGQISGVQAQIASVQQQQQKYWCLPVLGADGTPLTITTDDQGNVTAAQAIGTDGVKRSFARTSSFKQNKLNWYYIVERQEFFENDQRYFYATTWIYLWGRKVSVSMSGGGKDYGISINFPDDGSHDSTPIAIASGVIGQPFTFTQGTLYLNQGSISAPSYTADFALPPEIVAQQVNKTMYFQQLFDQENQRIAVQVASDQQAAGINPNMTLNQALYTQGTGQAATAIRPFAGGFPWGKAGAKVACGIGGGLLGVLAGAATGAALSETGPGGAIAGAAVGVLVSQSATQLCNTYVDYTWSQDNQPPPPADNQMPSDPSVQIDSGDPMQSGGDVPGICLPPEAPGHSVIIPFEETMADCL